MPKVPMALWPSSIVVQKASKEKVLENCVNWSFVAIHCHWSLEVFENFYSVCNFLALWRTKILEVRAFHNFDDMWSYFSCHDIDHVILHFNHFLEVKFVTLGDSLAQNFLDSQISDRVGNSCSIFKFWMFWNISAIWSVKIPGLRIDVVWHVFYFSNTFPVMDSWGAIKDTTP